MRFENFSSGYYCGSVEIGTHPGPQSVIHEQQLRELNERIYAGMGPGVFDELAPVVMKLKEIHLPVFGDDSVEADTLFLPHEILEEADVSRDSSETVFLVKPTAMREITGGLR